MPNSDLAFIIDDLNGVGIQLSGAYADWTLEQVDWSNASGSTGQSHYSPVTMLDGPYHAVVTASSPDGAQTASLMSASVSGNETTVYSAVYREIEPEFINGEPQEVTAAFGEHVLTGIAFRSEFRDDAPNNIYVTQANGIYTEYQYDTMTGEQGYIAAEDREDVMDWAYFAKEFSNGELSRMIEVGDDGVETVSDYNMGAVAEVTTTDVENAHDYEVIQTQYYDGAVSYSYEVYDDGVTIESEYNNGLLQQRQTIDNADTHSYEFKASFYDDGVIRSAIEFMDDGREISRDYSFGQIDLSVTRDLGDAYNYTEKAILYGQDGRTHYTLYDDGRTLEYSVVPQPDGTGTRIESWTLLDNEDAYSWAEQYRQYDENNKIELAFRVEDDGVETTTSYEDGVRTQVSTFDMNDARNFESTTKHYIDGKLAARFTRYDDGRENEWLYDSDGQLSSYRSVDTADAFTWTETTRTYGTNGDSELFRLYDDGIEQSDSYIAGERVTSQRVDALDARSWHSITDQFEDGTRVSRDIIWDDDLVV